MCLAQKLFSAFMWKRDRKGEEGLSSSKAVSTLGFFFFFLFPTVARTGVAQSTMALMTVLEQSGKPVFLYTSSVQSLRAPAPPAVQQHWELWMERVRCK